MPCRNSCRLSHPPRIHILRWSLKCTSVKRNWTGSAFSTNECLKCKGHGLSVSCVKWPLTSAQNNSDIKLFILITLFRFIAVFCGTDNRLRNILHVHDEYGEYFAEYYQSLRTLLRVKIMLRCFNSIHSFSINPHGSPYHYSPHSRRFSAINKVYSCIFKYKFEFLRCQEYIILSDVCKNVILTVTLWHIEHDYIVK